MMVRTQARKARPLSEQVAKAQRSLAGILHQVESPLPIVSEPVGKTTENRKLGHQVGLEGCSSRHFLPYDRRRLKGPASKSRLDAG
jgi:hypothetical protein